MKLYATATSERASKGQGGNKFIKIKLFAGNLERKLIAKIELEPSPLHGQNHFIAQFIDSDNKLFAQKSIIAN